MDEIEEKKEFEPSPLQVKYATYYLSPERMTKAEM